MNAVALARCNESAIPEWGNWTDVDCRAEILGSYAYPANLRRRGALTANCPSGRSSHLLAMAGVSQMI
jgi:hypothetical protein